MAGEFRLQKALEQIVKGERTEIFPAIGIYQKKPEQAIKEALEKLGYKHKVYKKNTELDFPDITVWIEAENKEVCVDIFYEKIGLSYYIVGVLERDCETVKTIAERTTWYKQV